VVSSADKNGWLSKTRTSASILHRGGRAPVVIVGCIRPGLTVGGAVRSAGDFVALLGD